MRRICHDCGREIPDDMDFCQYCGCMADKATMVDDNGIPSRTCPSCGAAASMTDSFCGSCGAKLEGAPQMMPMMRPVMRRNGPLAFILAVIPGFLNIFGLGHFLMKQWSRGAMFLCMSLVIWYVNGGSMFSSNLLMSMVSILVFIYQLNDISRVIFSPEGK